jgi:hypothetical protein
MLVLALLAALAGPGTQSQEPAAPSAPVQASLEQALARHPYFARIELELVESHPPYRFLVQKTPREDARRAAALVALYVPLLDPVLARFEQEVVVPLGLTQRDDRQRFTIVVLASLGDFANYQRATRADEHLAGTLHDRELNAAVVFEDVFQPRHSPGERDQALRHGLVHLCQQAWFAGGKNAALDSWVLEGQADAWARRGSDAAEATVAVEWLRAFLEDAEDAALRWTNLRTLEELVFVGQPGRLEGFFRTRTPKDAGWLDTSEAWWAFLRQASLVSQFLWEGENGARRSLALEFLRQALAPGAAGATGAASVLPRAGVSGAVLDQEFLAWIGAQLRARLPSEAFDPAALAKALERGPGGAPLLEEPDDVAAHVAPTASAEPAPPVEPAAAPEVPLDLADASDDERFALALHDLASGHTQAAIRALEEQLARTPEAVPRERLERELRRARAWDELAESFLSSLARTGGVLELTQGEKKLRCKVLGFADGELTLEPGRGPARLPAEELPALELAQQIKASPGDAAPVDWARLYPYVLADDPRARKLLREDGGEASALLRDAKEDYPPRIRLGNLAAELVALAAHELPATPKAVRAELAALRGWMKEASGLALLERKRPALRRRARDLLEHEAELLGPHTRLAGKFEALEGERIRITYAFDDPRELADFEPGRYPVMMRKGFQPTGVESEPMRVEGGRLRTRGETTLRTLFELGTPLTVRWDFEFANSGEPGGNDTIGIGVCDDGKEHFLWMLGLAHLQLVDGDASASASGPQEGYFLERSYAAELVHDGQRVAFSGEGQPGPELAAAGRTQGALFVFAHCKNELRLGTLVIEGRLLPGSFTRLVDAAIERELAGDF